MRWTLEKTLIYLIEATSIETGLPFLNARSNFQLNAGSKLHAALFQVIECSNVGKLLNLVAMDTQSQTARWWMKQVHFWKSIKLFFEIFRVEWNSIQRFVWGPQGYKLITVVIPFEVIQNMMKEELVIVSWEDKHRCIPRRGGAGKKGEV